MALRRVLRDHAASYADPIEVRAGDPLALSGREEVWDGGCWLWAAGPDGREGWVPDDLPVEGVAARDYSARELTCRTGDLVKALEASRGWVRCRAAYGAEGWVPASCLAD